MTLKNTIEKLLKKENLDTASCTNALTEMLKPDANPLQTAAFLVLLRSKPETAEELAALISALNQQMIKVPTKHKVLDIVGTGGDGTHTVNISTGSAILAASCGIKIAKHGNRAVSSLAGSADVLEALGINIHLSPEKIASSIDEIGIGFCYSPNFHPALSQLKTLRKQLNIPTTFNLLGPLLNPALPSHNLLGIYDKSLLSLMTKTLQAMGTERSIVVHSCGLDEISSLGSATLFEITKTGVDEIILDPKSFGFSLCTLSDLQGGNAEMNAQLLTEVFSGKTSRKHQAIADTLILNAATALYIYGVYGSISDAVIHAREKLQNGSVSKLLKTWIEFSYDK